MVAGSAVAADLPMRSAPPAVYAAPIFTWTGFYVGGTVGGNATRTSYDTAAIWDWEGYGVGSGYAPAPAGNNTGFGLIGGVHVGYNMQSGAFVYGLEADYSGAGGSQTNTFGYVDDYTQTVGFRSSLSQLATVRARLGYAMGPTLLYVTGGWAYGKVNSSAKIVSTDGSSAKTFLFKSNNFSSGWTVGAGIEHMIAPNWTVRAEALYVALGSNKVSEVTNYYGQAMSIPTKTDAVIARVGMSYKW